MFHCDSLTNKVTSVHSHLNRQLTHYRDASGRLPLRDLYLTKKSPTRNYKLALIGDCTHKKPIIKNDTFKHISKFRSAPFAAHRLSAGRSHHRRRASHHGHLTRQRIRGLTAHPRPGQRVMWRAWSHSFYKFYSLTPRGPDSLQPCCFFMLNFFVFMRQRNTSAE